LANASTSKNSDIEHGLSSIFYVEVLDDPPGGCLNRIMGFFQDLDPVKPIWVGVHCRT
jgi:hypothetical protein